MQHFDPRDKVEFKIINYGSKVQSSQMQHDDPRDKVKFSHTAKICKQITLFIGF